jgi:hypothetical protein
MEALSLERATATLCDKYSDPFPYSILCVNYSVENAELNRILINKHIILPVKHECPFVIMIFSFEKLVPELLVQYACS